MKIKYFNRGGYLLRYKVNNVDDILDLDRFKQRSFKDFKSLLGIRHERKAKQVAKTIFRDFMKRVRADIIREGDVFIFPTQGFGYMCITDVSDVNDPNYKFNTETLGAKYVPVIRINADYMDMIRARYRLRFNQIGRNQMEDAIKIEKMRY